MNTFKETLRRWWSKFKKEMKDLVDCTDWDKQLEFKFPEKKFDRDSSNDYNNKAKTGKQEKIS